MTERLRLDPGSIFAGDYKVVRPLRVGGQGSLYVVEQISTSKQRALKLMLPELVANAASRKRFELEAKIAARIQSDHVVESIASGVDQKSGTPWLVMELLEGQDLAAYTANKKRLPPGEVLEIFDQLCHALGEAHKQGIVHRDLKPENIFLATARRRGVPFMIKVLDFGIARILAEAQTISGATTQGLGTPMWMAPEQTVPGGPVSPATDVWPLGLLAFRLLTGYLFWRTPYDPGASVMMLMAEAFMHPLPRASERAEHYKCPERIPPGFDEWFARCVSRPMEPRYPSATEAFAALEPILAAVAEDTRGAQGRTSSGSLPSAAALASLAGVTGGGAKTGPATVTGPGMSTWGGAPELAQSAILSDVDAKAAPAPRAATPAQLTPPSATPAPTTGPQTRTVDHAPPVAAQTAKPQAGAGRTRVVIVGALAAGVLMGAVIFALQKGSGGARGPGSAASASASPLAAASASASAASGAPDAPDAASDPDPAMSADTAASALPASGAGRPRKICKKAGQKCLGNDDCCDRTCQKWICRENPALRDPYDK